jgi:hypothetical protein
LGIIEDVMSATPATPRYSLLRDLIALVVVAVACPAALFGGSMLGCVGQGFDASCALNAIVISPILLLLSGIVAGVVSRGWTGLLIVFAGTVIGMIGILLLSFGVGDPVPLDPFSGALATVWFYTPVAIGYGIGRLAWRLFSERGPRDTSRD